MPINLKILSQPIFIFLFAILFAFLTLANNIYAQGGASLDQQIQSLQGKVSTLEQQIQSLQGLISTLTSRVNTLETSQGQSTFTPPPYPGSSAPPPYSGSSAPPPYSGSSAPPPYPGSSAPPPYSGSFTPSTPMRSAMPARYDDATPEDRRQMKIALGNRLLEILNERPTDHLTEKICSLIKENVGLDCGPNDVSQIEASIESAPLYIVCSLGRGEIATLIGDTCKPWE